LLDAADGVERVLREPPPNVQFLEFGEYSLNFRLLVWTADANRYPQIRSDINYRIASLFRERGITGPNEKWKMRNEKWKIGHWSCNFPFLISHLPFFISSSLRLSLPLMYSVV